MADLDDAADETLIGRIARGDWEAFDVLYRRRRRDVYRFAVLVSGSPSIAEDVAQDVFVEVIHHAARFQPDRARVVPWLFGITRNHVLRAVRRQRTVVPLADVESLAPAALAIDVDPLADVERDRHIAALRRAVLELPVKYREAVVLCDLQELSYHDAAAALGCAIGTVRSRLHRGRVLLASRLRSANEGYVRTPLARWIV